jgi:membrane associated rhomboid family serine protease
MTRPQDAGADGQRLLEQAREAAERGEYEMASALYARLRGHPDPNLHVAGLLGLADSRYRLDDEEGALQAWITATQAPETPLTWQAWVALAGARVRQGDLPGATRSYREAARRAPEAEQPAIASRLGWLNKEMGSKGTAERYFRRARTGVFTPLATYVVLAVTVAISLYVDYGGPLGGQLGNLLLLDKEAVMNGEYWRLFTVTLVHGGFLHLGFNMYALYIVGPLVEALYGRTLFFVFYLLAAAGGSIASYLVFPNPAVGASGAIFGLFGLIFISTYLHKPLIGRQAQMITRQIGMLIVVNLVIGFGIGSIASIDNAAHVGGLLAGAWLGFLIVPRGTATLRSLWQRLPPESSRFVDRHSTLLAVIAVASLIAFFVIALQVTPFWV